MSTQSNVRPTCRGGVVGVGLGKFVFIGAGVALLAMASLPAAALAGPERGRITQGQGRIVQRGDVTRIRISNNGIINWDRFNIGRNERVRFIQPNASSRVLNRITGADPTQIDGVLRANGSVYIVNPAGVTFGNGAVVDVGQLYAAAGNISDADFSAGVNRFTGVTGRVENFGRIETSIGGVAALVGEQVVNTGAIESKRGVVAMVSGQDVLLSERDGNTTVRINPNHPGASRIAPATGSGVENSGTINAPRGRALMVAGDMYSLAVNNSGGVKAREIQVHGQAGGDVLISGKLDARNAVGRRGDRSGGTIDVSGERIALDGAKLDASGTRGGGTIHVGGEAHGQGEMRTAEAAFVSSDSVVRADAVRSGDGGDVVVWSDTHTGFYGKASARGGKSGGDGGMVETSGKQTIDIRGGDVRAQARCENGESGTWVLDPLDVTIDDVAGSTPGGFDGGSPTNTFTPPSSGAVVDVTDINAALDSGTNVAIITGSTGAEPGNITQAATGPIAKTAGGDATLTLRAANDITLNAGISSSTGQLNVELLANNSAAGNDDLDPAAGNVVINASASIDTNGGTLNVRAVDVVIDAAAAIVANGGATLAPTGMGSTIGIGGGAGDFNVSQAEIDTITTSGTLRIGDVTSGAIEVGTATFSSAATAELHSGSTIAEATADDVTDLTATGTLILTAGGDIGTSGGPGATGTGPLDVSAAQVNASVSGGPGGIFLKSDGTTPFGPATTSDGDIAIRSSGDLVAAILDAGGTDGDIELVSDAGLVFVSVSATATGDASFTASAANQTVEVQGADVDGAVSIQTSGANGDAILVSTTALDLGASSIGGDFDVTASGAITDSGTIAVGNNLNIRTLDNTGLPITLDEAASTFGGTITARSRNAADNARAAGNIAVRSASTIVVNEVTTDGNVTLTGPDVDLSSGFIDSAGDVTLQPDTPGATVALNHGGGGFSISLTDLTNIVAADTVIIGAADSGAISVGGLGAIDLSPGGLNRPYNLTLRGGALTFSNGITLTDDTTMSLFTGAIDGSNMDVDVTVGGTMGALAINNTGLVDLDTSVSVLAATSTAAISLVNAGPLTIGSAGSINGLTGGAGSDIDITSNGALTINDPIAATGAGNITLHADGADMGDLTINAEITSETGNIRLRADNDVAFTASADVSSDTGDIQTTADFDSMNTGGAGTGGDVAFAEGAAIDTGGEASVAADGDIADSADGGTPVTILTADSVTLTSSNGAIGALNGIETETSTLAANGKNGLSVVNTGDLVATLTADMGEAALTNTGTLTTGSSAWAADSFNITATGNISITQDVTADGAGGMGGISLTSSAGAISIADDQTVSSTNENMALSATDLTIDGELDAGTGDISITRSTVGTIGIGDASGELMISRDEFAAITADILTIGGANTTQITVNNIQPSDSQNIAGVVLDATRDDASITFGGAASTFNALTANADDGINVSVNLLADTGDLILDGDADDAADTPSTGDRINLAPGVILSTAPNGGDIALSATTGGIVGSGSATITATGDVDINNDLTLTSGSLTIEADADDNGAGTVTLASGAIIDTGDGDATFRGHDLDLAGSLDAGTGDVTIERSSNGTIGLGAGTGDMQLDVGELSRIVADNLTIGNAQTTLITVDGVNMTATAGIGEQLTLIANDLAIDGPLDTSGADLAIRRGTAGSIGLGTAMGDMTISNGEMAEIIADELSIGGGSTDEIIVSGVSATAQMGITGLTSLDASEKIRFQGGDSVFKSLRARSDDGIVVNSDITTTTGGLALDGDFDNEDDGDDNITINAGRTLTSAGLLNLDATTGKITTTGALSLLSTDGVTINDDTTTAGNTVVNADTDADGDGIFTVNSVARLSTSNHLLTITAADVALNGRLLTGAASGTITRSTNGSIGLGTATGQMGLTAAELGRITATGFTIGGTTATGITVDGLTSASTNGIAGTLTLLALADNANVTFSGVGSTFNGLSVRADNGVNINVALMADSGSLTFDANADNAGDGDDIIVLGADVSASGSGDARFMSPVRLGANITVAANDIRFDSRINSDSTARSLTLNSRNNGVTTLLGAIGGVQRLNGLTTNADGRTRLGADVSTTGSGIVFNDALILTGDSVLRDNGAAGIFFNSTVNSDDETTPRALTVIVDTDRPADANSLPIISFAANVGETAPLRSLNLNASDALGVDGHTNVPRVATIIARPRNTSGQVITTPTTPFSMSFEVTENFIMGQNEKLTSGGALTIRAGDTATLGDLTSLGNLTVDAPTINVLTRAPGNILSNINTLDSDAGLDFVVAGEASFSTAPNVLGTGPTPRFGTTDGAGDVNGTLGGFLFQAFGPLNPALINTGNPVVTLDLRSSGPTNTNIAQVLAGAVPRETRLDDVGQDPTLDEAAVEELRQLGVAPRELSWVEQLEFLGGWALYDDYPGTENFQPGDLTTTINRLPSDLSKRILARYDMIFNTDVIDPATGQPEINPATGKAKRVSRNQAIQDSLLESVRRFRTANPGQAEIDPAAFRAFLVQNPEEATALGYVRQIQEFISEIELLGLSPRELAVSKNVLLNPVRPRGIRNAAQLEAIIKAPEPIPGSLN